MQGTMVKLTGLYENRSEKGNTYFVGYMGGVKVLMLKDARAKEGDPQWTLFIAERPDKPKAPTPAQRRPTQTARRRAFEAQAPAGWKDGEDDLSDLGGGR